MSSRSRAFSGALALIVSIYLLLGGLYAVYTPDWQSPDEPAHYNYADYVALEGRLPVLALGDYPAAYLEEIKARRFAPELPIDDIRYESHQPPAYYLIGALLLRLAPASDIPTRLLLLRLFSVVCGACALIILAVLTRRLFGSDTLALGASAVTAGIPMFVAITASANNDALAFVSLGLVALRLAGPAQQRWSDRGGLILGLLLGLCLLVKFQAYVAVPLVIGALLWDRLVDQALSWRRALRSALIALGVAALMVLPWISRNLSVYGWFDPLGLRRHSEIVVGQLRTAQLLSQVGWRSYLYQFARTTWQSFWGQFGWMAAPLPERAYLALGLFAVVSAAGMLSGLTTLRRSDRSIRRGICLLVGWALLTGASFLWYNLQFVQFQGRYLFPALAPLVIALVWGLIQAIERPAAPLCALGVIALALLFMGIVRADLPFFSLALTALVAGGLVMAARLPRGRRWVALALIALCLYALTLYSLFGVVLPQLSP